MVYGELLIKVRYTEGHNYTKLASRVSGMMVIKGRLSHQVSVADSRVLEGEREHQHDGLCEDSLHRDQQSQHARSGANGPSTVAENYRQAGSYDLAEGGSQPSERQGCMNAEC